MYVVVDCPRCGRLFIKKRIWKYYTCPYCGYRFKAKKYRVFKTLSEARVFCYNIKRRQLPSFL